jgi:hypothetical protein
MSAGVIVYYVGRPEFVSLAAQVYGSRGFEVSYKRPIVDRAIPNLGGHVIVGMTVSGATDELQVATRAVNKRLRQVDARVQAPAQATTRRP